MFTEDVDKFVGEFYDKNSEIKITRGFLPSDGEKLFYTKIQNRKQKPIANLLIGETTFYRE